MENKQISMRTIIVTTIATVLGSWLAQQFLFKNPTFDERLMTIANELNKNCPIMVDSDTRLDNAIGGPGKSFIYNYTLVNYSFDQINPDTLVSFLKPTILNMVRTNPAMQHLRDNNVTIIYSYKDKNGVFLSNIEIRPQDYKD